MRLFNKNISFRLISKENSDLFALFLTILLSVLVVTVSISYARTPVDFEKPITTLTLRHAEFDNSFFKGIEKDNEDLSVLRHVLSLDNDFYLNDLIHELMLFHMDIVFLLGLVFKSLDFYPVFTAFFILKFGAMAGVIYIFLRKILKLQKFPSMLLSIAFSVSGIFMTSMLNTALVNMMLVFPVTLLLVLKYAREGGRKNFYFSLLGLFVLALTGIYGVISGLLGVLIFALVMVVGTRNTKLSSYLRVLSCWVMGVCLSGILVFPVILSGDFKENYKQAFLSGTMKFTLFDSLYKFMDGNIIGGTVSSSFPAVGLSIFILMLFVLFFLNRSIPFRFKLISSVSLLIAYISISYSAICEMILFRGSVENSFVYSRLLLLAFFVLVLAAISFKNLSSISNSNVYGVVFAIIIFLILSNNSKTEIVHSTVSLYLSAFAAIISGVLICALINKKGKLSSILMFFTILIIAANSSFCVAPSNFPTNDLVVSNLFDAFSSQSKSLIFDDNKDQYLVSSSDISISIVTASPYEQINMLSKSLNVDDVFLPCECYPVYYSGVVELGGNKYGATDTTDNCMLNIRINKNNKDDICYISSSYIGSSTLRVVYDDYEEEYSFDGPFMWGIDTDEETFVAAIEYAGTYIGSFELAAVTLDKDAANVLKSCVRDISNSEINLSSNSSMMYVGTKNVLTSLMYSPRFEVIYTRDGEMFEAETFNLNGYLAFNVNSGGFEHQQAKIISNKSDFLWGFVVTDFTILSFILITFMYNRYRRSKEDSVMQVVSETGEQGLDKQKD